MLKLPQLMATILQECPNEHSALVEQVEQVDESFTTMDSTIDCAPTPLPKLQLFIVIFIQISEPVTSTVIYPFVNELIRSLGVTNGDEKRTGYYVGIVVSRLSPIRNLNRLIDINIHPGICILCH
jgi:hypothetical protein